MRLGQWHQRPGGMFRVSQHATFAWRWDVLTNTESRAWDRVGGAPFAFLARIYAIAALKRMVRGAK